MIVSNEGLAAPTDVCGVVTEITDGIVSVESIIKLFNTMGLCRTNAFIGHLWLMGIMGSVVVESLLMYTVKSHHFN